MVPKSYGKLAEITALHELVTGINPRVTDFPCHGHNVG